MDGDVAGVRPAQPSTEQPPPTAPRHASSQDPPTLSTPIGAPSEATGHRATVRAFPPTGSRVGFVGWRGGVAVFVMFVTVARVRGCVRDVRDFLGRDRGACS